MSAFGHLERCGQRGSGAQAFEACLVYSASVDAISAAPQLSQTRMQLTALLKFVAQKFKSLESLANDLQLPLGKHRSLTADVR